MPVTRYEPVAKAWGNTYMPQYRLEGNTIRFAPPPSAVYTLRITYSTGLAISSLTDSVLALPGCDEWLVLDVCELIREREDKDASNFSARKMQIEADLKSQAMQRDRHGVTTVRDVRGEICDDDDRLFWRNRWGQ
jgi:hypothetical protein